MWRQCDLLMLRSQDSHQGNFMSFADSVLRDGMVAMDSAPILSTHAPANVTILVATLAFEPAEKCNPARRCCKTTCKGVRPQTSSKFRSALCRSNNSTHSGTASDWAITEACHRHWANFSHSRTLCKGVSNGMSFTATPNTKHNVMIARRSAKVWICSGVQEPSHDRG